MLPFFHGVLVRLEVFFLEDGFFEARDFLFARSRGDVIFAVVDAAALCLRLDLLPVGLPRLPGCADADADEGMIVLVLVQQRVDASP